MPKHRHGIRLVILRKSNSAQYLCLLLDGMRIIWTLSRQRNVLPFEGEAVRGVFVSSEPLNQALRADNPRLWAGVLISRTPQGRALTFGCHSHLLRHIDLRAIRRILLSIDLDAFTASIPVRRSTPTRERQNKANVVITLEIHRGLTAHEKPVPTAEVFRDDE